MSKILLISADSHAGPRPEHYADWLDPPYRDGVADLIKQMEIFERITFHTVHDEESARVADARGAIRGGGREGLWDPGRRLSELEAEGVAAEIIFPGDPMTLGLYFSNLNWAAPADFRAAGCVGYNRWLAQFCRYAPDRMVGVAQTEPWPDMAACVDQIGWAAKHGLRAIGLPRFPGIEPNQPPLTSPAWAPFWAACAETALPVCVHVGHGYPQGELWKNIEAHDMTKTGYGRRQSTVLTDPGHRPLWELITAGVFDRHPDLKLTFTELRAEWVAPMLAKLEKWFEEGRFGGGARLPKLRPTDYWRRNCALGASSTRPFELSLRHQIGVEQMMFGTDYPHPEGTWPNTREWLQVILEGIPEREARLLLGENAARVYGLDLAQLAQVADRVGWTADEILRPAEPPPRALIESFDWRAGFLNRPDQFDTAEADAVMAEVYKSAASPAHAS
jgi:predicted TIM-barrel fold metal-dependent hydrolase